MFPTQEILNSTGIFWQYPVITEQTFYNQNKDDDDYLGFPWATCIDKRVNTNDLLKLIMSNKQKREYYTCCQHISFRQYIGLFKILGITTVYSPHKVKGEDYIKGVNITIPHKRNVVRFMDELSAEAEFIGAVNTIVRKGDKLVGYNTDGQGFMKSLEEEKISLAKKNILILGAGGASFGICRELLSKGIKKLTVANRTFKRAEDLQKLLVRIDILPLDRTSLESVVRDTNIIINTTSVGMKQDDPLLINENCITSSLEAVVDIIYSPLETKLLKIAKNRGVKTVNGLNMLLHQGALSFKLWTGKKAPVEVMGKALHNKFKI